MDEVLYKAEDMIIKGRTRYRGMTYEEGVANTIRWIKGDSDDVPYGSDEDEDL